MAYSRFMINPRGLFLRHITAMVFAVILLSSAPGLDIAHGANLKEGDPAPPWPPMEDMSGVVRSLQDHLGKDIVLLDFWSIYCVSCVQEMPSLVDLYEKYKDKGFIVYGVDLDSFSPSRVKRFIDGLNFKIPYPVIIDRKRQIATTYRIGMLPTTIIIDKDGRVRMFHIGYKPGDEDEFDHLIKSLVN